MNGFTTGTRSPEIVAGFSPRQRDWYKSLLPEVVPFFGYELMHD